MTNEQQKTKKVYRGRPISESVKKSRLGQAILEKYPTIGYFARELGISARRIYEQIQGEIPKKERAEIIAKKLGKSIYELFDFWREVYNERMPDLVEEPRGLLIKLKEEPDSDLREEINCSLSHLPERQRRAVELKYGLGDEEEHTYVEVAAILGFRFRQQAEIEVKNALEKLRRKHSKNLRDFYFKK